MFVCVCPQNPAGDFYLSVLLRGKGEAVEGLANVVGFEGNVGAHAGGEADHRNTPFPA